MFRCTIVGWSFVALCACGGTEQKPAAGAEQRRPAPPLPPPAAAPEAQPTESGPALVPLDEPDSLSTEATLVFASPKPGEIIPSAQASRYVVRVDAASFFSGDERRRVALTLDDERVRYLKPGNAEVRLSDLIAPDRNLSAGAHRLLAVAVDHEGLLLKPVRNTPPPYSAVRFFIDVREPEEPARPSVVFVEPQGTYNGAAAAAAARLDFYLLDASLSPAGAYLEAKLRREGRETVTRIDRWTAYAINGLVSGDYDVELALFERGRPEPMARAARTITVNLEANAAERQASPPSSPSPSPSSGLRVK